MTKIYVAGPMTGLPESNFPAFHAETARLRGLGYDVINPAEINPDHTTPWIECMKRDIKMLVECQAVAFLPGWQQSKGASLEYRIASELGIRCALAHTYGDHGEFMKRLLLDSNTWFSQTE